MAIINHEAELARAGANVTGWASRILFFARRYPLGAVGAVIVLVFVSTAIFAPWIAPMDPTTTDAKASLARPGGVFWLGADFMGRDMYSRIVFGARISLTVGLGATLAGGILGDFDRPDERLPRRYRRSRHPASDGHHAVAAAPGDGPGHGRGTRARRSRTPSSPSPFPWCRPWPASCAPARCRCASNPSSRRRAPSAWVRCASLSATCCPTPWRR